MPKNKENFFEKQWVKLTGVIIAIAALISIGYSGGTYKANIDCKIEQMKIMQEYNEKIQSEDFLCKTTTILGIQNEIGKLKEVTNNLDKPRVKKEKIREVNIIPKIQKDE